MITVCIPNYNHGRFLTRSISSALSEGCEVIVVDDGSTDESREVIEDFASDITAIFHEENTGYSSIGANEALAIAKNPWFGYLAADDFVLPGYGTLPDEDYDWVFCNVRTVDERGNPTGEWSYADWSTDPQDGLDRAFRTLSVGMPYLGCQRVELLKKAGGWRAHAHTNYAEDSISTVYWLLQQPRIKHDTRLLYAIRDHWQRLTHTSDRSLLEADMRELMGVVNENRILR